MEPKEKSIIKGDFFPEPVEVIKVDKRDGGSNNIRKEGANRRNPEQGETKKVSQVAWQVLRVSLLFPILGRILPRDLSPLKPVLVEGVWDRVRSMSAPIGL